MINQNICPFCKQPNECSAKDAAPCWCFNTEIPNAIRQILPEQFKDTACICNSCVTRFKQDPQQFKPN